MYAINKDYIITLAQNSDLAALARYDNANNITAWSHKDYVNSFNNSNQCIYVVRGLSNTLFATIIGACVVQAIDADNTAEILQLWIRKKWQKQGIATNSLLWLIHRLSHDYRGLSRIFLEVRTDNKPAVTLYHKLGFFIINTRYNYYQLANTTCDAHVMMLDVKTPTNHTG